MNENLIEVIPTPMGNKMYVTANKREVYKSKGGLIMPDGAMNVELLDVQTVVEVGEYLKTQAMSDIPQFMIEVGDVVIVDWDHPLYRKKKTTDTFDDRNDGSGIQDTNRSSSTEFAVPMYEFGGVEVIEIDKLTIKSMWKKNQLPKED